MKGPPSKPNQPIVSVEMKDEDVLQRVAALLGVKVQVIRPRNGWAQTFAARLRGRPAVELMILLRPLMGERRQRQIDRAVASHDPDFRRLVTPGQVLEVRRRFRAGESARALATEYGITHWYVYAINQERPGTFGKPK